MEELINLLHSGGYSCVIANGDNIRTSVSYTHLTLPTICSV